MTAGDYQDLVQEFYVGFYGRPADVSGWKFWTDVAESEGWTSVRDAFANSDEAQEFVFTDPETGKEYTNPELVDNIYQNLYGREADQAGKDFYVDKLESGEMSMSTIVHNVIDGAQGEDKQILANKVEVAEYFSENLGSKEYGHDQIEQARSLLQGKLQDVDAAEDKGDKVISGFPGKSEGPYHLSVDDLGDISQGDGVTVSGQIENQGQADLQKMLEFDIQGQGSVLEDSMTFQVSGGQTRSFDSDVQGSQDLDLGDYELTVSYGNESQELDFSIQNSGQQEVQAMLQLQGVSEQEEFSNGLAWSAG